jgi:hypothetical protein
MHISQDLRCNKVFVKQRRVYASGLACVAEKVSFTEVRLGTNTMDGWTFSRS